MFTASSEFYLRLLGWSFYWSFFIMFCFCYKCPLFYITFIYFSYAYNSYMAWLDLMHIYDKNNTAVGCLYFRSTFLDLYLEVILGNYVYFKHFIFNNRHLFRIELEGCEMNEAMFYTKR